MNKASRTGLNALLGRLTSALATLSGALFLLLAFMMALETASRHFGGPFTGFMDQIAALVMALGGTWSLAHSLNMRSHVRIDVISNLFPRALNRWCQILAYFAMSAFAIVLAVETTSLAYDSYRIGALVPQSMIHFPLAVPQAMTVVGFGLLALQALLLGVVALGSTRLPDDPETP